MNLPSILRIGTRASDLALAQTGEAIAALRHAFPALEPVTVPMQTTGDRIGDRPLYEIGGKALFCRELDLAVLNGSCDLAVHSLKDVPTWLPDGLVLAAVLPRADVRDVLVARSGLRLADLPLGTVVGTSSLRRQAVLASRHPHLVTKPIRGNVPTRLQKLADGQVDALVLARAGLERLGLLHHVTETLSYHDVLPCATQGIIGLVCRADRPDVRDMAEAINHLPTWRQATAERAFLDVLQGSCKTPVGALADFNGGQGTFYALLATPDGQRVVTANASGFEGDAVHLARDVARQVMEEAGPEMLALVRGL